MEQTSSLSDASLGGAYQFGRRSFWHVLKQNWFLNLGAIVGMPLAYGADMPILVALLLATAIVVPATLSALELLDTPPSSRVRAACCSFVVTLATALLIQALRNAVHVTRTLPYLIGLWTIFWLKMKFDGLPYIMAFSDSKAVQSVGLTWRLISWERWWMVFALAMSLYFPLVIGIMVVTHFLPHALLSRWLVGNFYAAGAVAIFNFFEPALAFFCVRLVNAYR